MGHSLVLCVCCGSVRITRTFFNPHSQAGSGLAICLVSLGEANIGGWGGVLALPALRAARAELCWWQTC